MPRRAPLPPGTDPREHPALKGGHVVILGGEKPLFPVTGPVGHAALGNILEQQGFDYEPCHGKYQGDKQPSYIVHVRNDGEDETLKGIAKRMGQESVVHSEGGKHQLVYLNGENKGKATAPSSGLEWYGDNEPDDNYTTLYGASGEPLGHFQYTMDFKNDMVPDGPGPMVDVPEAAQQVLKSAVESYRGILLDLRKRETEKLAKAQTIDGRIAKYMAEGGHKGKVRGHKPSSDISTQGPRTPSAPHSGNIVSKTETPMKLHDLMKSQAHRFREPSHEMSAEESAAGAAQVKRLAEDPALSRRLAGLDARGRGAARTQGGSVKKSDFPATNKFSNKLAAGREQSSAAGSPAAAGAKATFTDRATTPSSPNAFKSEESAGGKRDESKECGLVGCRDPHSKEREYKGKKVKVCGFHADKMDRPGGYLTVVKGEESMAKAQCECGKSGCQWCGKTKPKQSNEQGEHGGSPKRPSYQPGDEMKVTKSIWKKATGLDKAETHAHANAKRNGGIIKLGKQEFYLDHQNPTAPQKDDKSKTIPGGKETGWRNDGDKPKVIERSASGGAITGNKPKAGPDQKNTSENSVTEGALKPKATPKNDLIEKAAADFHKRTGGRFQRKGNEATRYPPTNKKPGEESTRPSPEESALDEGRHNPQDFEKAATSMGAPKAPSAGGAGSPSLSGGAPTKPPTAHAGANPKAFSKALMPFSEAHAAQAGAGPAPAVAAPSAPVVRKDPSQFDPSLYAPPAGGVKSGLLSNKDFSTAAGPMSGVGVTPRPAAPSGFRSPAQHKGISGFLGKQELCKSCGKSHKLGKCG